MPGCASLDAALLYVLLALGLNIVVGYAGLLDLGYVAFYAIGAYMFALLASPHLTDTFPAIAAMFPQGLHMPLWIVIPAGRGAGGRLRRPARRADAQAARRLPGDRDARLRRNHPGVPEQPGPSGQHHQRPQGHEPDRPDPFLGPEPGQAARSHAASRSRRSRCTTTCSWRWCWSASSSATACSCRASAAPGWRSARTKSPPRRWASTPAT